MQNSSELEDKSSFGVLLDNTNLYAEAGGQENDTGNITIAGTTDFVVTDVQSYSGYVLHVSHLKAGQLRVGDEVTCTYDKVSDILQPRDPPSLTPICRTVDEPCK